MVMDLGPASDLRFGLELVHATLYLTTTQLESGTGMGNLGEYRNGIPSLKSQRGHVTFLRNLLFDVEIQ